MEGSFRIFDGEETSSSSEAMNESMGHDEMLLKKAKEREKKSQLFLVMDLDSREIRLGVDVKQTRDGLFVDDRIYFHQILDWKRIDDTRLVLTIKPNLNKTFTANTPSSSKKLEEMLAKHAKEPLKRESSRSSSMVAKTENESPSLVITLSLCLLITVLAHCYFSPYTKVEESFNIQAMHDMIKYPQGIHNRSILLEKYDHIVFPGVVPRTFWGALLISSLVSSSVQLLVPSGKDNPEMLILLCRSVLGSIFVFACGQFAFKLKRNFSSSSANWFLILLICQFHLPFYSTRPLPNVFATILIILSQSLLLDNSLYWGVAIMIIATVIFRSDMLILLAPTAVWIWLVDMKWNSFMNLISNGIIFFFWGSFWFVFSLGMTMSLDHHMWNSDTKWYWPEGIVLYYNTILNKSSNWGTSPFHWYFTSALPRALLISYVLFPLGIWAMNRKSYKEENQRKFQRIVYPSLCFVLLYSILPHKEVRFLFPVLPAFTFSAAIGMDAVIMKNFANKYVSLLTKVLSFFILFACGLIVLIFSYVSSWNYPAGYALRWLQMGNQLEGGFVHIDVYSAMSGINQFGYLNTEKFHFSKQENEIDYSQFDYLISHEPKRDGFVNIHAERGEPRINFRNLELETHEVVFLLKRQTK